MPEKKEKTEEKKKTTAKKTVTKKTEKKPVRVVAEKPSDELKKTSKPVVEKKTKKRSENVAQKKKADKLNEAENWDLENDMDEDADSQRYDTCPPTMDQMPYQNGEEKPTLTRRGLEMLTSELKELKSIKRQEVAERIRQARALGDISENSEYEEAKRDQAMFESRILELERLLQSAIIVDETLDTGKEGEVCVRVGTKIKVENLSTKEKDTYKIVGTLEADPLKNSISNSSPFGRSMIGRQMGEVVKVLTPQGFVKYRILDIKKGS
jgi:transcription elongation factor GreA